MTAKLAEQYYADRLDIDKQKVKADLQILGIAMAKSSKYLLTKDSDFADYISRLGLLIELKNIADL